MAITTCKLIAKNVLGADTATVSLTLIPATYTDLLLVMHVRSVRSGQRRDALNIGLNSSTADFTGRRLRGSGSAASSATTTRFVGEVPAATATADTFSSIEVYIPNYAGATNKSFSVTSVQEDNQAEAYIDAVAGLWSQTAAITDIAITSANSVDIKSASSFFLYGITKA